MTLDDYCALPAFMSVYEIEKMICNAIGEYKDGKFSDRDFLLILFLLSDNFINNIEKIDLSDSVKKELEKEVYKLWNVRTDNTKELILNIIFFFGLQESFDKIISNLNYWKEKDIDVYNFLNELINSKGRDISNYFAKKETKKVYSGFNAVKK